MLPPRPLCPHRRVGALPLVCLLLLVAAPAGALTQGYRLTGEATVTPEGGSVAALTGRFELVRGPLCALPPGQPPVCTEPPQWIPGSFDLAGGGLVVASGAVDPIALLEFLGRGQILLDPVTGLDLLPVVLARELLVDNAAGQVFREIRLAPLDDAADGLVFDPASDLHPSTLSLLYELQERVGTIRFPQPPVIGLPTLESETVTPLALVQLSAQLPEPGAAVLLGLAAFVQAAFRRR